MSHAGRPLRQGGFTLMEMLVTLVIVALATGLVGQALFQATRLEQRMAHASTAGAQQTLQRVWLRRLLEGVLPKSRLSPDRLLGERDRVQGTSTTVPAFPDDTAQRFMLRLTRDDGATQLRLRRGADDEGREELLLTWRGERGAFHYMDAQGQWHDRWPPPSGKVPALPTAIALETGLQPVPVLVAGVLAQGEPPVLRRELEQL